MQLGILCFEWLWVPTLSSGVAGVDLFVFSLNYRFCMIMPFLFSHIVNHGPCHFRGPHGQVRAKDFCDSWWCVLATLPNMTFAQDENGQHIRQQKSPRDGFDSAAAVCHSMNDLGA